MVGGIEDIKNNIIRCVGEPCKRFEEDRLRILRVFRFTARTGGIIDKVTSNAIKEDNRLMGIGPKEDVSQERIFEEWNKMREHAEKNIKLMQDYIDLLFEYDMFEQMFPGLNYSDVIVTSLENSILFYDLFWDNENEEIIEFLIKFPSLSSLIIFFREIEYKWENIDNVYKLALYYKKMNMTRELFLDFVNHIQQGGYYTYYQIDQEWTNAFLNYCNDGFVIDGNDLVAKGFKGHEIYQEKQRLEIERFKNEYLT